jgi:hypothetical protein
MFITEKPEVVGAAVVPVAEHFTQVQGEVWVYTGREVLVEVGLMENMPMVIPGNLAGMVVEEDMEEVQVAQITPPLIKRPVNQRAVQ